MNDSQLVFEPVERLAPPRFVRADAGFRDFLVVKLLFDRQLVDRQRLDLDRFTGAGNRRRLLESG